MQNHKISKEVFKYPLGIGHLSEVQAIENRQYFVYIIFALGIWIFKRIKILKNRREFIIIVVVYSIINFSPMYVD